MEALSGLLGVFIGGVITAGVEAWKQRREADAEALAAARVLQAELRWAVLALTEFRDKGQTEGTFVSLARSSRWHEQQAAIARRASHDVWGCIEGAMEARYMLFACLDDAPEDLPIGELHEPLLAQWQTELEIGSSALAALEAWCEPKRTPGTPLPARTQIEASVRSTT